MAKTYLQRHPNTQMSNSYFRTDLGVFTKLNINQEQFIKLANAKGFIDKISKKDILEIVKNNEVTKPRWLMHNDALRLGGGMFELPTYCSKDEFEEVFMKEDLLIDKILTHQEKQVIYLRFGIVDGQKRTLLEVCKVLEMTRKQLRKIEIDALEKLEGQPLLTSTMNLIV